MKKQLCKTFRTMAAKLKDEIYEANASQPKDYVAPMFGTSMKRPKTKHPVNHYRRLKRIFTREGVKGVELYYKKHVA